jgi:cation/acetate symporter
MHFDPYILTFSSITVLVTILMGFLAARKSKTAHDFFVAGRSVSVGWNASAISGEYLSAASFMGIAGMVMSAGYDALWYPVCYACGYLFLLLFIAGPLRRFGAYTIPDFAEGRFDSPLFRKIAVIFVLFIGFFYTMPQMKGAGTTLAYILPGLPYWAGVALVGAVITLNVALGGMKGITLVQAFQYWAKMFAISVPIFVLMSVYGHYGKQVGANSTQPPGFQLPANITWRETTYSTRGRMPFVAEMMMSVFEFRQRHWPDPLTHSFAPSPVALSSINGMLNQCMEVSGMHYQMPVAVAGAAVPFGNAQTLNGAQWIAAFEKVLGENEIEMWNSGQATREKLVLLRAGPRLTYVLPETLAAEAVKTIRVATESGSVETSESRRPLPKVAPADEKWLSPFGPLTTKAAKAAAKAGLHVNEKLLALLYTYSLIIALVCGTAGLPHILVRFYTNPDGVAAKRTTMWVMILIGIFYVFPPVFGVMGRNLFPELYAGVGAKGTDKIVLELPRLLNERFAPLGSVLSGITCAGAFAAFMSTFSGLLVSMTGALAHDVYGRMIRPRSTPEQRMKAFKVCAVLVGAIAIFLGMQVEQFQINFMVGQAFAIAAASYFPLLFMSAWWRGMTMKGAACGMLTGGCLALLGISLTSFSDLKWLPLDAFWATHPLLRILCEQPAIWAVPLSITLMVVVSKLTRSEIPADIRMKMLVLHAPEKLGLKEEYIRHEVA